MLIGQTEIELARDLSDADCTIIGGCIRDGQLIGAAWRLADEIKLTEERLRKLVPLGRRLRALAESHEKRGLGVTEPTGRGAILPFGGS